ncbi:hypothetical protein GQ44DRAFT_709598 [Phaeosphaeriaceae sp. PMI808]|nr:hypothetical protein GQ44DRAFT_709598 [Phaeosphaeriaceae sp. PMI808]
MNWEIPVYQKAGAVFIDETTTLCHKAQTKQKQSQDKYPRLKAHPGGFVAMRYMENGHVTKPENQKGKPKKGGTIFVYGTTEPKEDEKIVNVLQWSQDGKGGDGRGALLAMNDFDDGRCYENNATPEHQQRGKAAPNYAMGQVTDGPGTYPLMCETNVQLPKTAAEGKPYTLYWVWQWNTAPGGVDPGYPKGKDEYYSTCIDVDVASAQVAMAASGKNKYALGPQQDAMSVAVDDWASRTAIMTDPLKGEVGPYFSGKQTASPTAPGGAPSQKPSVPALSSPTLAPAPTPSSKAPGQLPIPTLTKRPGSAPSSGPGSGSGSVVTVTDTVIMTVTASRASQTPPASTRSAKSKAPTAPSPSPESPVSASPSQLPGFNMRNKNSAKFRAMFA